MINNKCFEKHIPSIFVVGSPLQVLCAAEAIHEFEISDYICIVPYFPSEVRNSQTFLMLDLFKIKYQLFDMTKNDTIHVMLSIFKDKSSHKYKRAFIGDCYQNIYENIAMRYLQKGSSMVYMDDGNSTLSYMDGYRYSATGFKNIIIDKIERLLAYYYRIPRKINFFTIYESPGTNLNIYPNNYGLLSQKINISDKEIYILGTNTVAYTGEFSITQDELLCAYETIFLKCRAAYPDCKLIFIPHGRDNVDEVKTLCESNDVEYRRLSVCIELYLAQQPCVPFLVAGIFSSALFNIKKIFRGIEVKNYYPYRPSRMKDTTSLNSISAYYKHNGIEDCPIIYK